MFRHDHTISVVDHIHEGVHRLTAKFFLEHAQSGEARMHERAHFNVIEPDDRDLSGDGESVLAQCLDASDRHRIVRREHCRRQRALLEKPAPWRLRHSECASRAP